MFAQDNSQSDSPGTASSPDGLPEGTNLEELAQKVFELLLEELKLENERTGRF
jgi:hypothetical protein